MNDMRTFILKHNNTTYRVSLQPLLIDLETKMGLKVRYPKGTKDIPIMKVTALLARVYPMWHLGNVFGEFGETETTFRLIDILDVVDEIDIEMSDSRIPIIEEFEIMM